MGPRFLRTTLLIAVLSAGGAAAQAADPAPPSPATSAATAHALGDAFVDVVERLAPTTVHLRSEAGPALAAGLQQLLRDYEIPAPGLHPSWSTQTGSGVIIRPEGLVLTNHHVVAGATALVATLHDRRSYPAIVIGGDARTDVALVRIVGDGPFPVATIGDSDRVRPGQWVLAIGHPFDFQFSVSAGIVSARGRRNIVREEIQDYIQTDAALNPGSSGGPLFNLDGELVGINTAIFTPDGGSVQNAGISFAIPSNMAWRVASELIENGRVKRPAIGLTTRDAPAVPGHPQPGAEVTQVVPDGPAERAGVRRGDVIVRVDGEPVASSEDLRGIVLAKGASASLAIDVDREGAAKRVQVASQDEDTIGQADVAIPAGAIEWAGLTLVAATPDRATPFGVALPEGRSALLVLAVTPESPTAAAGLAPGDLVLAVQKKSIRDPAHFLELVGNRSSATVTFWRKGGENYAAVAGIE